MTAGNSTPLTDGASAVLLGSQEWAAAHGLRPLAWFVDGETAAVDYVHGDEGLLMAPAYAVPRLLARNGLTLQDFDFYEIHEAFAATVLSTLAAWEDEDFCRERLGLDAPLGAIDRAPAQRHRLVAGRRAPVRRDRRADRRHAREAAPREGARLPRPDLDLRRRRAGRRRDPRGGLTWRTATATRPSSPRALGKKLATTLGLPQPVALRRYVPGGRSSTARCSSAATPSTPALAALRDGLTAAGATLVDERARDRPARRRRRRPHRAEDPGRPRGAARHPRPRP